MPMSADRREKAIAETMQEASIGFGGVAPDEGAAASEGSAGEAEPSRSAADRERRRRGLLSGSRGPD